MATHSSVLAWRIPVTGEPGGLPSMGSQSRKRLKRLSSSKLSVTKWGLDCSDLFQWISFRGLLHIKLNPVWWLCSVFNLFNLKTPIYTFNQNSISFEVKPTLYGHGFGQTPRDSGGHGSLACCSPWGHKQSDTPEWLNNNDKRGLSLHSLQARMTAEAKANFSCSSPEPGWKCQQTAQQHLNCPEQ